MYIFDIGGVLENLRQAFQKKGSLMVAINNVFGLLKHLIQGCGLNLKPSWQKREDSQLLQENMNPFGQDSF